MLRCCGRRCCGMLWRRWRCGMLRCWRCWVLRRRCRRMLRRWRSLMLWRRRCRPRRRSSLRRFLGRVLGLAVGTQLLLLLRHDDRGGLRVRWSARQWHGRQCGRGKQQRELSFCHVLWVPGGFEGQSLAEGGSRWEGLNQQTLTINGQALGRIVAGFKRERGFISRNCAALTRDGSSRVHTTANAPTCFATSCAHCRRWRGGTRRDARHRQFVRQIPGQFIGACRFVGLTHRRRNFGPRISRRVFARGLAGLPGRRRRIFGRIDWHRIVTRSSARPLTTSARRCSCAHGRRVCQTISAGRKRDA